MEGNNPHPSHFFFLQIDPFSFLHKMPLLQVISSVNRPLSFSVNNSLKCRGIKKIELSFLLRSNPSVAHPLVRESCPFDTLIFGS